LESQVLSGQFVLYGILRRAGELTVVFIELPNFRFFKFTLYRKAIARISSRYTNFRS